MLTFQESVPEPFCPLVINGSVQQIKVTAKLTLDVTVKPYIGIFY